MKNIVVYLFVICFTLGVALFFWLSRAIYLIILQKDKTAGSKATLYERRCRISGIILMVVGLIFMIIANIL